jgi:hypothetical protein
MAPRQRRCSRSRGGGWPVGWWWPWRPPSTGEHSGSLASRCLPNREMHSFAEMCWFLGAAIFGVSEIRDLQSLGPVDRSKSLVKIPPLRLIRDLGGAEMPPCGLFFFTSHPHPPSFLSRSRILERFVPGFSSSSQSIFRFCL